MQTVKHDEGFFFFFLVIQKQHLTYFLGYELSRSCDGACLALSKQS